MQKRTIRFSGSSTDFYFDGAMGNLKKIADPAATVIITDENVWAAHTRRFKGWQTIVLPPGESFKVQSTVDTVIEGLIRLEADRKTLLVGVGGGVITDITGYVASIYMRGLAFGFIPTSLLALVDASIGGKNGIDVGLYKNMVGVIRQPAFILHDLRLLQSLPLPEWENGFAEIIKHAAIRDAAMFRELGEVSFKSYRGKPNILSALVRRNALLKAKLVQRDEFEKGERRLLNFGHTLGHAIENQYGLMHGQAVAIGMVCACRFSEQLAGFKQTDRVVALLERYGLPAFARFDKQAVFDILRMDKKRERNEIHFVLLDRIGRGKLQAIPLRKLEKLLSEL